MSYLQQGRVMETSLLLLCNWWRLSQNSDPPSRMVYQIVPPKKGGPAPKILVYMCWQRLLTTYNNPYNDIVCGKILEVHSHRSTPSLGTLICQTGVHGGPGLDDGTFGWHRFDLASLGIPATRNSSHVGSSLKVEIA